MKFFDFFILLVIFLAGSLLAIAVMKRWRSPKKGSSQLQTPASAFKKCTCTSKNVDWGAGTGFHIPTLKLDPSCPRHGVARLEKN